MVTVNVREARESISRILDAVANGEEVVILRRGEPAARLTGPASPAVHFPDRSGLREDLPPMGEDAVAAVRAVRDAERF